MGRNGKYFADGGMLYQRGSCMIERQVDHVSSKFFNVAKGGLEIFKFTVEKIIIELSIIFGTVLSQIGTIRKWNL